MGSARQCLRYDGDLLKVFWDFNWRITCLSLLWIVWRERNAQIFENMWRTLDSLWDLLHFFVSFWAYCIDIFKPYPLSVIHLSWLSICSH